MHAEQKVSLISLQINSFIGLIQFILASISVMIPFILSCINGVALINLLKVIELRILVFHDVMDISIWRVASFH
jgi:hypothetical protein